MAGCARAMAINLTKKRRRKLEQIVRADSSPQRLVLRAKIVLAAAGATNMDPAGALAAHHPGDQQAAAQHIDRLIECIVRVRDGPGEMSRDGNLHGCEPSGPVLITRKDVQGLARIRKG